MELFWMGLGAVLALAARDILIHYGGDRAAPAPRADITRVVERDRSREEHIN